MQPGVQTEGAFRGTGLRWDQGCLLEGLGRTRDTEETHGETRRVAPGTRALQAKSWKPRVLGLGRAEM